MSGRIAKWCLTHRMLKAIDNECQLENLSLFIWRKITGVILCKENIYPEEK